VGEEADFLEDVPDAPAELERIPLARIAPFDDDLPTVRDDQPVDQLEQRALTRAAPPDQRERLAGRDIKTETAQDRARRPPGDVDVADSDGEISLQLPAPSFQFPVSSFQFQPSAAYRTSISGSALCAEWPDR
jgi:hypothetical protein